jgi:hypothetical protein
VRHSRRASLSSILSVFVMVLVAENKKIESPLWPVTAG